MNRKSCQLKWAGRPATISYWTAERDEVPALVERASGDNFRTDPIAIKIWAGWGWPPMLKSVGSRCLYVARAPNGATKIGFSGWPVDRVRSFTQRAGLRDLAAQGITDRPPELLLVIGHCQKQHESALHKLFSHERLSGEWFRGPCVDRFCALIAPPYAQVEAA